MIPARLHGLDAAIEGLLDLAIQEAIKARDEGAVPVGSVVVDPHGRVAGVGRNRVQFGADPTAHAEIEAIRSVPRIWSSRESGWQVVTSAEPCLMCLGAILQLPFTSLVWATNSGLASAHAAIAPGGYFADRLKTIEVVAEPTLRHRDKSRSLLRTFYDRRGESWRAARWRT